MNRIARRLAALTLILALLCASATAFAAGEKNKQNLPVGTTEGYKSGADWFGDDVKYDITDEAACWELLQRPITVLDVNERETVYPLDAPGGKKVLNEWQGGFINGQLAAVHVLGEDEDGYTLIEGMDYYNRIISGYVKTKLLKQRKPNEKYGIIVDKLTQRLYVFIDGKLWSSCAVSTGKPNADQPYNETSAGEFLTGSWVGGFGDEGGMQCDMAIRYNGGDMLHQVPYVLLADGSKRFSSFETLLGQRASHGCIRVARIANEDGLSQRWLWENLKKGTKVIVWDDAGREAQYPADDLDLFYNPSGGKYYHANANCNSVRDKYLPLTGFKYSELDADAFAQLEPCPSCTPVKRKVFIDQLNLERGVITQEEYDRRVALHHSAAAEPVATDSAETDPTDAPAEPQNTEVVADSEDDVVITIIPAK